MMNSPISQNSASILNLHNLHRIPNSHLIIDMLSNPENLRIDRLLVKGYISSNLISPHLNDRSRFIDPNSISTKYIPVRAVANRLIGFSYAICVVEVDNDIYIIAVIGSIATADVIASAIENSALLIVILASYGENKQQSKYPSVHIQFNREGWEVQLTWDKISEWYRIYWRCERDKQQNQLVGGQVGQLIVQLTGELRESSSNEAQ